MNHPAKSHASCLNSQLTLFHPPKFYHMHFIFLSIAHILYDSSDQYQIICINY